MAVAICRDATNVTAWGAVAAWPSESWTVTFTPPLNFAGVTARIWVGLTTCADAAGRLPNWTTSPARKLLPEIVTAVPPAIGPLFGEMLEIAGGPWEATVRARPTVDEA